MRFFAELEFAMEGRLNSVRGAAYKAWGARRQACAAAALAAALAAAGPAAGPAAAAPQRVVSINLCADQYLLALADSGQIAALSAYARDPAMSYYAEAARAFPTTGGTAEEVIRLAPDLVMAGDFTSRTTRDLLKRLGYRLLELPAAESLDDIRRQTRQAAEALGAAGKGAALLAAFERRLAAPEAEGRGDGPLALYYQRRGFATGAGTLMDAAMRAAGMRNLAGALGLRHTARLPLEAVVAGRPDLLLLDQADPRPVDRGTELLEHPALAHAVPPARRITVPQRLIACGGPWLADAIERMRAGLAAVRPLLPPRAAP